MSGAVVTARAFFEPRAPTATCCWHSVNQSGDSTSWDPVTYDPINPYITSFSNFGFWVDWCRTAWCNTETVGTTCVDGSIRGISMSSACGGTARCLTETMYQKYGDTTPKLHKVFCHHGDWVARTYYIEQPPARRADISSLPASSPATTTLSAPSSTSSASSAASANSNTSSPAQTNSSPPPKPATDSTRTSPAVIAGSVIGGVALISIITIALLWFRRKSKRTSAATELPGAPVDNYNGYQQYPQVYDKYYQAAHITELPAPTHTSELPAHVISPQATPQTQPAQLAKPASP